jgi:hypothetical protein
LIFVSDFVRSTTLSDGQYAALAQIVAPLTDDERALGGVFAREFTAYPGLFTAENRSHFLKTNATLNLFWDRVETNAAVSRASCRDYQANTASSQKAGRFAWLGYAYNPVGKILLEVGAPLADQYIMSMCDLAGMQSIVALQVALKAQHIADSDIETYIQRATERNPYSGAPLLWDPVGRTLRFVPVANSDGKYFPWPI